MIKYRDVDGDSGVQEYELGDDYIKVQFKGTSKIYTYSYQKAGKENVEIMKKLAPNGTGLNSFINTDVKDLFDK